MIILTAGAQEKPNIIFIFADDLGYGDLGAFFQNQRAQEKGVPAAFTPKLDKLAEQGAQLTQQYCAAPVCAPSRGSLLTGRSQGHANVRDNQFDKALEDNHTLGTILKTAGYSTAAFGKWGLQGKSENIPDWPAHHNKRGFDYYYGYIRHGDGHEHYPKEGVYRGSKEVYENYTNFANQLDKCYTADLWTAAAKRWITEQKQGKKKNKPFFVYLAFDTPNAVLELPTQEYPKGGGLKGGLQWIGEPGHMINTASGEVDSWTHPDYANATYDDDANPSTPEVSWPDVYKRFAIDTRRIDDAVGDIVQLLKDLKIDKNTMIVFASDNGPSKESYLKGQPYDPDFFKSYALFDGIKRDVLEGGVRVPVIAWWPGQFPAGRIVETPSVSYDWMPTFAEMAGIPTPALSDGVSLLPSLTGVGKQKEGLVYVEYFQNGKTPNYYDFTDEHQGRRRAQMQMIRFGNLVGLRYDIQSHNDNFKIYNVKEDPQESVDLASKSGMAAIQQKMKDKVLQSRRPDDSAPRPYDNELIPAVKVSNSVSGVKWSAFKGEFPWIPEISSMTPTESGYSEKPSVQIQTKDKNGILHFTGYIRIPKDGEYNFSLTTGSEAILRIHDCLVIDEDFGYQNGTKRSGIINLKEGMHPFRLYSAQKTKVKPILDMEWSGPDFENQNMPSSVFFHD